MLVSNKDLSTHEETIKEGLEEYFRLRYVHITQKFIEDILTLKAQAKAQGITILENPKIDQ